MQRFILLVFIVSLFLTSCEKIANQVSVSTSGENVVENYVDVDTETNFGFPGTYQGTLPCKDCDGIVTSLTLTENSTYVLNSMRLGKKDTIKENGIFTFDPSTSVITTMPVDTAYFSKYFEIAPEEIYVLASDKKRFFGEIAEQYVLKKK